MQNKPKKKKPSPDRLIYSEKTLTLRAEAKGGALVGKGESIWCSSWIFAEPSLMEDGRVKGTEKLWRKQGFKGVLDKFNAWIHHLETRLNCSNRGRNWKLEEKIPRGEQRNAHGRGYI